MTKGSFYISPLMLLVAISLLVGAGACKNKKKMTDVSDTEAIQEELEEEIESGRYDEETEEEPRVKPATTTDRLQGYFSAISAAPSLASANGSITEALTMFSTSNAPVLIVIYKAGGTTDYDEPTTISKYLNYLKDTKSKPAEVEDMVLDSNGKIKELVLSKD